MSYTFVPGEWDNCNAWIELTDDAGNVTTVLRCSLNCHADPNDATVVHRDPRGFEWRGELDD